MADQWHRQGASEPERLGGTATRGQTAPQELIWQERLQKMMQDAEQNLPDGALTAGYKADPREIVALLQRAQAGEWASFLQYWHHVFMASDLASAEIREVFKDHAEDEYEHARMFGERIQQLGGVPCDKPEDIAHFSPMPTEYNHDLRSMLEADLIGERQTIDFYEEIIRTCGFADNATRRLFEHALEEEVQHADELATILFAYDASTGKQIPTMHEELVKIAQERGQPQKMARRAS